MIPIPKYAKNLKINIVEDKETNTIKEIHCQYEIDDEKLDKMFASKTDNTPSMARLIINQCQLAHELFTETIKNNKKQKPYKNDSNKL